jgi:hypothetical protein
MSAGDMQGGPPPTEEELRAAYEAEIKKIRVDQILLENVVTLINLGMRRTGMSPGTEDERDLEQVRLAIESIRAQLPLIEQSALSQQAGPIREALSQLQLAFVRLGGAPAPAGATAASGSSGDAGAPAAGGDQGPGPGEPEEPPAPEPPKPGEPGPAQRSGRLWVPGQ